MQIIDQNKKWKSQSDITDQDISGPEVMRLKIALLCIEVRLVSFNGKGETLRGIIITPILMPLEVKFYPASVEDKILTSRARFFLFILFFLS
jgi:hypothetical protein